MIWLAVAMAGASEPWSSTEPPPESPWDAPPEPTEPVPSGTIAPSPLPPGTNYGRLRHPPREHGAEGLRIAPIGGGARIDIEQQVVVGTTGGTDATTLSARYVRADLAVTVGLPFAAYPTPGARELDLGNATVAFHYSLPAPPFAPELVHAAGIEAHFPVGSAYTWVNRADDLWPGGGADLVWQGALGRGDSTYLLRAAVGLHGARGFFPLPPVYLRANLAAGVDHDVSGRLGVVGEASFSWWEVSPIDLAGLVRLELAEAWRARAGVVLPIGVWTGLAPTTQRPGLTELTATGDLSLSW